MILVTGGAGFIGSHVVDTLVEKGYEVLVIDNLTTGKLQNLKQVKDKIEFHRMDILDEGLKEVLKDVEGIIHLAAQINVRKSVEDPSYDLDVNAKGTLKLLESSIDGVEQFVFASSGGAVYGEPKYLPVDEAHETNPISPYGVSKLTGEKYLFYYSYTYGLKTCSLRYGNVYGPRQDPKGEAGVIAIFQDRIEDGKQPIIFGDGEQTRDFVHVNDIVQATLLAMSEKGVYNIGTGKEVSVNRLVEVFSKVTGENLKPLYEEERKGEVKNIYLDVKKARKEIGYNPKIDIEEGIKLLYE